MIIMIIMMIMIIMIIVIIARRRKKKEFKKQKWQNRLLVPPLTPRPSNWIANINLLFLSSHCLIDFCSSESHLFFFFFILDFFDEWALNSDNSLIAFDRWWKFVAAMARADAGIAAMPSWCGVIWFAFKMIGSKATIRAGRKADTSASTIDWFIHAHLFSYYE